MCLNIQSGQSEHLVSLNSDLKILLDFRLNWLAEEFVYYSDREFTEVYTVLDALNKRNAYMKPGQKGYRLPTKAKWC